MQASVILFRSPKLAVLPFPHWPSLETLPLSSGLSRRSHSTITAEALGKARHNHQSSSIIIKQIRVKLFRRPPFCGMTSDHSERWEEPEQRLCAIDSSYREKGRLWKWVVFPRSRNSGRSGTRELMSCSQTCYCFNSRVVTPFKKRIVLWNFFTENLQVTKN